MGKKRKAGVGCEDPASPAEEPPPEYQFIQTCGSRLRLVKPYKHCFRTHAKARWLGRAIHEVCATEFGARTPEYYRTAIDQGDMCVNGAMVPPSYILCNNDLVTHETMRHEPPVLHTSSIAIVGETEEMVAVDKPPTIPVHPSGAYYHNTLLHILAQEQPQWRRGGFTCSLHTVHRLDRLTSGLVLLAKTPAVARRVSTEIVEGRVSKVYLARVTGHFPGPMTEDEFPEPWRAATICGPGGAAKLKEAVHAENAATKAVPEDTTADQSSLRGTAGSTDIHCDGGGPSSGLSYASIAWSAKGAVLLLCPLRCMSHRDGIHECHPRGRPAATEFQVLGYDSSSNTSLVRCTPLTGRTHQIRIHLQQLGYPIANDPCYGGAVLGAPGDDAATEAPAQASVSADIASVALDNSADGSNPVQLAVPVGTRHTPAFTETQLRCRGIWLHALRYSGVSFSFETQEPSWALPFIGRSSEVKAELTKDE